MFLFWRNYCYTIIPIIIKSTISEYGVLIRVSVTLHPLLLAGFAMGEDTESVVADGALVVVVVAGHVGNEVKLYGVTAGTYTPEYHCWSP